MKLKDIILICTHPYTKRYVVNPQDSKGFWLSGKKEHFHSKIHAIYQIIHKYRNVYEEFDVYLGCQTVFLLPDEYKTIPSNIKMSDKIQSHIDNFKNGHIMKNKKRFSSLWCMFLCELSMEYYEINHNNIKVNSYKMLYNHHKNQLC